MEEPEDALEINNRLCLISTILETRDNILIDIYVITNTITKKQYVGQTVTHRLNHGKYRPFGYIKRFKDHLSEALCNTKTKQCRYLNNSIRKYGPDAFIVELIDICLPEKGNDMEIFHIDDLQTLHPKGYNLTTGGCQRASTLEQRIATMKTTQRVSYTKKLSKFENVYVDPTSFDQYIREYKSYGNVYYCVKIGDTQCIFVGKYQKPEEIKSDAVKFLEDLVTIQSRHHQIAGNSLELLDTTSLQ